MSLLKVNEVTDLAGVIPDGVGRIVQIVRATDSSFRSTTSTSFQDTFDVTITPTSTGHRIVLIATLQGRANTANYDAEYRITDSSDTSLMGYAFLDGGSNSVGAPVTIMTEDSPGTTSAVTYKLRFRSNNASGTAQILGSAYTSQLFAIEVAA